MRCVFVMQPTVRPTPAVTINYQTFDISNYLHVYTTDNGSRTSGTGSRSVSTESAGSNFRLAVVHRVTFIGTYTAKLYVLHCFVVWRMKIILMYAESSRFRLRLFDYAQTPFLRSVVDWIRCITFDFLC